MSHLSSLLSKYKITNPKILRNLCPAKLYEYALLESPNTLSNAISSTGALISYSGKKTGRSPKDKRIVDRPEYTKDVDWGDVNIPLSPASFKKNVGIASEFLNSKKELFVFDGFAGWRTDQRLKVRVVAARPYHALFMHNMLISPTESELDSFGQPDVVILNAGECEADPSVDGMTSKSSIAFDLHSLEVVILGTEYAGCMKKAIFTIVNFLYPKSNILSLHCSANHGTQNDTALFLGLSGTGKTTLSSDPSRHLIGDDEHGWDHNGVFNVEGGCYAKAANLSRQAEPEIFDAIKFGAVLENVIYNPKSHDVDYNNTSITENTRASYPLEHVLGSRIPAVGHHPNHIIFLSCDAFGVLPPVAKLNPEQAMYHFMSGYSAKVAGTEQGVNEPQAVFSACFGSAFMVWSPLKYAELLKEKMKEHQASVWLVNTGWSGGKPGTGKRFPLKYTRGVINAILNNEFDATEFSYEPIFGLSIPTHCKNVPSELLNPKNAWHNINEYTSAALHLKSLFESNFQKFFNKNNQARMQELAKAAFLTVPHKTH